MSRLVSGHSGIIAPRNILPNGNFSINQRGFGTSVGIAAVGDYVSDLWKMGSSNVDQVKFYNWGSPQSVGAINCFGYGQKGQSFTLDHKFREYDYTGFAEGGGGPFTNRDFVTTAAVNASILASRPSVPILVSCHPPYADLFTNEYDKQIVVNTGELKKTAVNIRSNYELTRCDRSFGIVITLQETGSFEIILSDARMFEGAFKNPPKHGISTYAEDLMFCQRYYQKGYKTMCKRFAKLSATEAWNFEHVDFPTIMGGIPTVTLNLTNLTPYNGAGVNHPDQAGGASPGVYAAREEGFRADVGLNAATYGPALYDNGGTIEFNWTAEIV